jgi:hypothetical protein
MELIRRELVDLELVAALCGSSRLPLHVPFARSRSAWHVTNLLISGREIIKGNVDYYEETGKPSGPMAMGLIWESVMDHYLFDYACQLGGSYAPDTVCMEADIVGSLDGLMTLPEVTRPIVCEIKWRFSMEEDIPLDHLQQMKAYCHMAETPLVCYVSAHAWSDPPLFTAMMRFLRFNRSELEETWQSILNTKRFLENKGKGPKA